MTVHWFTLLLSLPTGLRLPARRSLHASRENQALDGFSWTRSRSRDRFCAVRMPDTSLIARQTGLHHRVAGSPAPTQSA